MDDKVAMGTVPYKYHVFSVHVLETFHVQFFFYPDSTQGI